MAFSQRIDITEDGNIPFGYFFNSEDLMISQVISGSPQYYAGSTILFEEIIRLTFEIDRPELVDVDNRWFDPKVYLASYQVSPGLTGVIDGYTDQGHCNQTRTFLKYYSQYVIGGDANIPIGLSTQNDIVNCNFYLQPEVYLFPDNPAPVAGFRTHEGDPAFLATNTIACAPLQDTKFSQKARSIGVYPFAGVRLTELLYIATDINKIKTNYPPYASPTCEFRQGGCDVEFQAFLLAQGGRFRTQPECETANPDEPCAPQIYICSTDPTKTYTYYTTSGV